MIQTPDAALLMESARMCLAVKLLLLAAEAVQALEVRILSMTVLQVTAGCLNHMKVVLNLVWSAAAVRTGLDLGLIMMVAEVMVPPGMFQQQHSAL